MIKWRNARRKRRKRRIRENRPIRQQGIESDDEFEEDRKHSVVIDWEQVRQDYSGILVVDAMLDRRDRFQWYDVWDVPSAAIWNEDAILSVSEVPYA